MAKNSTRRNFLRAAPIAAVAGFPLAEQLLAAPDTQPAAPELFQVFTAAKLADSLKAFEADPGQHYLYQPTGIPLTIAITTEGKTAAKEFEYHEGRDHVFLILDGSVKFEIGGTPKDPRNTRPGEWLAPDAIGATTVEVHKGDMLIIPRGTPHRQTCSDSVKWMLISPSGAKS